MIDEKTTGEVNQEVSVPAAGEQELSTEVNALEEFLGEEPEQTDAPETETETEKPTEQTEQEPQESKGIRGRINAASAKADKAGYDRGRAEAMKEWEAQKAEYESKLAKYAEAELEEEARKLSTKEHCSIDLARRILRMERGITSQPKTPEPENKPNYMRDDGNEALRQRADMLMKQSEEMKAAYGIDPLSIFNSDPDVKAKVVNGEWDFKDVALNALSSGKKRTPSPVRSGGGRDTSGGIDFDTMTDEQFKKFQEKIERGAIFKPRR